MQKSNHIGSCGCAIQANSEDDAINQALKDDDFISLLRKGYTLLNTVTTKLSSDVCPFNSGFDVYYVNSQEMLCIRTNVLSLESVETILSATNLNRSLQVNLWSAITENK